MKVRLTVSFPSFPRKRGSRDGSSNDVPVALDHRFRGGDELGGGEDIKERGE
jgi:hypothetical protein